MKTRTLSPRLRSAALSVILAAIVLAVWQLATLPKARSLPPGVSAQYAELMGMKGADSPAQTGFPTPAQVARSFARQLRDPFYDHGPNDKGIGLQLGYSLARVAMGFGLAVLVALPLGFLIGLFPVLRAALDPFIQVLKPISPLAWMPIALYTLKDANVSAVFVIFICSVWPMLINTAFGVAGVRREWLGVARTLEVRPMRKAFQVILPAAAPTILTGMRISMGIAWLVIVAAEMLVGGTGIGYFVWNEWNNLALPSMLFAIFLIGVVGMLLDLGFARLQRAVTYAE